MVSDPIFPHFPPTIFPRYCFDQNYHLRVNAGRLCFGALSEGRGTTQKTGKCVGKQIANLAGTRVATVSQSRLLHLKCECGPICFVVRVGVFDRMHVYERDIPGGVFADLDARQTIFVGA